MFSRSPLLAPIGAAVLAVLLLAMTPARTAHETPAHNAPDTTKPLRPLMVGLAQDMDRIATGLWYQQYNLIQEGASGIANHPKISPDDIAKIKKALGDQFTTFVQYDRRVHKTSAKLVTAAEARNWSEVLRLHEQLQRGCVTCHTAFRTQLRPVLGP